MKLLFLGSGSAFTVGDDNFQSNIILTSASGRRLLIDCGSDIRWSLAKFQLSAVDLTDIYVSHLHGDHVGGLEYVGLSTKFIANLPRPRLHLERRLVEPLWNNVLSGAMTVVGTEIATLESFFEIHPLDADTPFLWEGASLTPVEMIHIDGVSRLYSYGLEIEWEGRRTFITTDTRFTPERFAERFARADLIFHDCETSPTPTTVHANYQQLLDLPESVRRKTWLYGYQPGARPNAVDDGFSGFVSRGQRFDI